MFDAIAAYVKDPFRMLALACWSGAAGLTVLLIILANQAVLEVQRGHEHMHHLHAGDRETIIADRKRVR